MTDLPQARGATARVINYLQQHPDAWTYEVSRACAVANVPDVAMKFNLRCAANNQPFKLRCEMHQMINRFGREIRCGRWRLIQSPSIAA